MLQIVNSFIAHMFFVFVFSFLYFIIGEHNYKFLGDFEPNYITYFNLAITIQAGIGFSSLVPNSQLIEILLIFQQAIAMGINIIIYWYFTKFLHRK